MPVKISQRLLDFLYAIDDTHMGLGMTALALYVLEIAKISTKIVGFMGSGKSRLIELLQSLIEANREKNPLPTVMDKWQTCTYEIMYEKWGILRDTNIVMLVDDLRSFNEFHMQRFCEVVPSLMTNEPFYHKYGDNMVDIANCPFSAHIGLQPRKDADLISRRTEWANAAQDRMFPIAILNCLIEDTIDAPIKIMKNEIPYPRTYDLTKIPIKAELDSIYEVFGRYFSTTRTKTHARKYMQSLASIMGHRSVNSYTVRFAEDWLIPVLDLYRIFVSPIRGEFGADKTLSSKALTFVQYVALEGGTRGVTRTEVAEKFDVSKARISDIYTDITALSERRNMDIIVKRKRGGKQYYVLGGKYADYYFKQYRRLYK